MGAEIVGISRDVRMSDVLVSYDFPPMIGGAHSWLYELYRRWPTEVQVLTAEYSRDEFGATREREFDAQTHGSLRISRTARTSLQIDLFSGRYVRSLWQQTGQIQALSRLGGTRSVGCDVVHALRAFPEGVAGWLCCRRNSRSKRLVTYVHGEEILVSQTSRQLTMLANRVYRDSDLVIANSESTRRILADAYPGVESLTVHPGVDVSRYANVVSDGSRRRTEYGWPKDTVVVLTLARMEARKNHAMVIRSVAKLRAEGIPVALICGGEGPEREMLKRLVEELHVNEWVRLIGAVEEKEKPKLFSSADLFAMPSITVGAMIEGFGIVFLEAAAAGLPTVCGKTGGQGEAVLNGKSGIAVDGESLEAVANAIRRLACSGELRKEFGDAGRKWAAENDWDVLGSRVQSAIRGMENFGSENPRATQR